MAGSFRSKHVGVGVTPRSIGGIAITIALIAALWGLRHLLPAGSPLFYGGAALLVLAYCIYAFRSAARARSDTHNP